MSRSKSSSNSIQWSLDAMIWLLMVSLMGSVALDVSVDMFVGFIIFAFACFAVAYHLIVQDRSIPYKACPKQNGLPGACLVAVVLGWAMLGWSFSPFAVLTLVLVGGIPLAIALRALAARDSLKAVEQPNNAQIGSEPDGTGTASDVLNVIGGDLSGRELARPLGNSDRFEPGARCDSATSGAVTQWMTRSVTNDGEIIEGGVRIDFAEGQRDATVHISFCPPFLSSPEVMTETLDDADVEIRVGAKYPFGSRLTIRRSGLSNSSATAIPAATCRIAFVAIAPAARRAA